MYRTTSALALGLFLGLAPAAVQAQQDTQQQDTDQLDIQVQEDQQQEPGQQAQQQPDQQRSAGLLATEQQGLMVDSMVGANVYSAQQEDESIGSIDDVLITVDGQVEGVIIGVGGWLGVGQRDVLVSMNDLSLEARGDELRLVLQRTREELESEPEFRRVDEQRQARTDGQPGVQGQVGTARQGTTPQDETQLGTAQQDTAGQDTAQPGTALQDEDQQGMAQQGMAQQDTAQQDTAQQDTAQQDTAQQDTMQPEPRDDQVVFQDEDSILASTMVGTDVQVGSGEDDEELGQISDVVITMEGQVEGVVIGVGGFLGLGEKDVVVAMDQLNIQRTENEEVRVTVQQTRQELEAAESFQRPQQ